MIDREEILAYMLNAYRQELEALTDDELIAHYRMTKRMAEMTDDDWRKVKRNL